MLWEALTLEHEGWDTKNNLYETKKKYNKTCDTQTSQLKNSNFNFSSLFSMNVMYVHFDMKRKHRYEWFIKSFAIERKEMLLRKILSMDLYILVRCFCMSIRRWLEEKLFLPSKIAFMLHCFMLFYPYYLRYKTKRRWKKLNSTLLQQSCVFFQFYKFYIYFLLILSRFSFSSFYNFSVEIFLFSSFFFFDETCGSQRENLLSF